MKELKYISRYVKRHGLQYILGIAALFAVDLMNVYIPRYTGEITDGLEAQTLDMDGVLGLILRILILGAIVALGRFFWNSLIFGPTDPRFEAWRRRTGPGGPIRRPRRRALLQERASPLRCVPAIPRTER